ncbi:MAG: hypothetical protein KDI46_02180 [Alphaproteobacteria bacterium]|nr:hypothetical protein [Alphaproteobacteria bacterium]
MALTEKFTGLGQVQRAAIGATMAAIATLSSFNATAEGSMQGPTCLPQPIDPYKEYTAEYAQGISQGGRVVLHYGEGVSAGLVRGHAGALQKRGYPVIAMAGGPDNKINQYWNGQKLSLSITPQQLSNGTLVSRYIAKTYDNAGLTRPSCDVIAAADIN